MTRFTRDPKTLMWLQACRSIDQLERFRHQAFRPSIKPEQALCWEPPVDILETQDRLLICVALPGVAPEHVSLEFEPDLLTISAASSPWPPASAARIRRKEIPCGKFKRLISLPHGHFELEHQEVQHGCLRISLHKR